MEKANLINGTRSCVQICRCIRDSGFENILKMYLAMAYPEVIAIQSLICAYNTLP
jgi:hypothetical protein